MTEGEGNPVEGGGADGEEFMKFEIRLDY